MPFCTSCVPLISKKTNVPPAVFWLSHWCSLCGSTQFNVNSIGRWHACEWRLWIFMEVKHIKRMHPNVFYVSCTAHLCISYFASSWQAELNIASGQRGIHRHVFAGTELLATLLIFMFTVVYLVAEVGLNFSRKLSPSSWTLCTLAKIPA